jgi:arsenate reductase-like glutaredoxin family protein
MYKQEEWQLIPKYSKRYLASNLGRVKTLNGRILRGYNQNGYKVVKITDDTNVRRSIGIHRLVAMAFLPNPLNLPSVNHINKIRHDNSLENLEWLSVKDNNIHSKEKKITSFQGGSKFYERDLKIIHKMLEYGIPRKEIEEIYNLDRNVLTNLFNSNTYQEDCKKLGLAFNKFSKKHTAKIIETNSKEIKQMLLMGYGYRSIAKKFNVSHSSIIQFNKDIVRTTANDKSVELKDKELLG